jgi:hypothetical protein
MFQRTMGFYAGLKLVFKKYSRPIFSERAAAVYALLTHFSNLVFEQNTVIPENN